MVDNEVNNNVGATPSSVKGISCCGKTIPHVPFCACLLFPLHTGFPFSLTKNTPVLTVKQYTLSSKSIHLSDCLIEF